MELLSKDLLKNWESWLLLIAFLSFLTYAALAIRKEKKVYLRDAKKLQLGPYQLTVPSWWTEKKKGPNSLSFYRADTHYDWQAEFIVNYDSQSLEQIFQNFLTNEKIVLDREVDISHDKNLVTDKFNFNDSLRVEGMATQNNETRIYLDIALIKEQDRILFCKSLSSVLNGAVEGPYFEEVIQRVSLNH